MQHISPYDSYLNEATERNDKQQTDHAFSLYQSVYKLLKNKEYQKQGDTFFIRASQFCFYKDLLIYFVHPSHPILNKEVFAGAAKIGSAIGHSKDGRFQIIICSNLIAPGDDSFIETRLQKASLIHELIHYLDSNRYVGKVKPSADKATVVDYFNTPSEFNAFYQENAYMVRNMMNQAFLRTKFMKDLPTFLDFAHRMMNKDFMQHLNPTYKRKLDKRLANLYTALLTQKPEIE